MNWSQPAPPQALGFLGFLGGGTLNRQPYTAFPASGLNSMRESVSVCSECSSTRLFWNRSDGLCHQLYWYYCTGRFPHVDKPQGRVFKGSDSLLEKRLGGYLGECYSFELRLPEEVTQDFAAVLFLDKVRQGSSSLRAAILPFGAC